MKFGIEAAEALQSDLEIPVVTLEDIEPTGTAYDNGAVDHRGFQSYNGLSLV
jgi:hypothetical protein